MYVPPPPPADPRLRTTQPRRGWGGIYRVMAGLFLALILIGIVWAIINMARGF